MSDKLKKAEILDCCHSQQCKSLTTLSGQEGGYYMRVSLIRLDKHLEMPEKEVSYRLYSLSSAAL
jgi:hypothetical protein